MNITKIDKRMAVAAYSRCGTYEGAAKSLGCSIRGVWRLINGEKKEAKDWWFNRDDIDWSDHPMAIAKKVGKSRKCVDLFIEGANSRMRRATTPETRVRVCIGEVNRALKKFAPEVQKEAISILSEAL